MPLSRRGEELLDFGYSLRGKANIEVEEFEEAASSQAGTFFQKVR
jgi:hypothetical protein